MDTYRSLVPGRDGFRCLLRAEWTKLASLRSSAWCVAAGVALTIALSTLFVASSKFFGELPQPTDDFGFVHRPMPGDGSVVARVASQQDSHPWAKAGIII